MNVKVSINVLHVPERCTCKSHPNKVFHSSGREVVFASPKLALETLAKWNNQQGKDACWVHEVTGVEPTSEPAEFR